MVFQKPATFVRPGHGVRPGDDIVVVGFPLHGLLTSNPSVTTGNVSALAGPGDDRRFLQITAPVQQGNSGGPALCQSPVGFNLRLGDGLAPKTIDGGAVEVLAQDALTSPLVAVAAQDDKDTSPSRAHACTGLSGKLIGSQ